MLFNVIGYVIVLGECLKYRMLLCDIIVVYFFILVFSFCMKLIIYVIDVYFGWDEINNVVDSRREWFIVIVDSRWFFVVCNVIVINVFVLNDLILYY